MERNDAVKMAAKMRQMLPRLRQPGNDGSPPNLNEVAAYARRIENLKSKHGFTDADVDREVANIDRQQAPRAPRPNRSNPNPRAGDPMQDWWAENFKDHFKRRQQQQQQQQQQQSERNTRRHAHFVRGQAARDAKARVLKAREALKQARSNLTNAKARVQEAREELRASRAARKAMRESKKKKSTL
jgi:hypothetical protein